MVFVGLVGFFLVRATTQPIRAAINQLAFGANPSVAGGGGPGAACGTALSGNALIFMIIDECPASNALSGGSHCDTCTTSEVEPLPLRLVPDSPNNE